MNKVTFKFIGKKTKKIVENHEETTFVFITKTGRLVVKRRPFEFHGQPTPPLPRHLAERADERHRHSP